MSFLSKLFGGEKFDDSRLESHAWEAVHNDPMISDPEGVVISSKKGVITLGGPVKTVKERDRIEGIVREALRTSGLKYESIYNELKVPEDAV